MCSHIRVHTLYINFTALSIVWCWCIERFTPNNVILRERSLFQTVSFVTCSVSPSITPSIVLCLFLSFSFWVFPSPSPSVILYLSVKLSHTNKHFSQWAIAAGLNCLSVWKKALIHTQSLSELEIIPGGINNKSSLSGESIAVQELR